MFAKRMFEKLPSMVQAGLTPTECLTHLDEYSLRRLAGEHLGKLNALDLGASTESSTRCQRTIVILD